MRLGKPGGKGRRWLDSQKEQNKASVVIPLCQGDLHPHLLPPSSASAPRKQAGDAGSPGTDAGCTHKPSRDREGACPAHQVTAVLTRQGVPLPLGSRPCRCVIHSGKQIPGDTDGVPHPSISQLTLGAEENDAKPFKHCRSGVCFPHPRGMLQT